MSAEDEAKIAASAEALIELGAFEEDLLDGLPITEGAVQPRYLNRLREQQPIIADLDDGAILAALGVAGLQSSDIPSAYRWFGSFTRHASVNGGSIRAAREMLANREGGLEPGLGRIYQDLQANLLKAELTKPDGFAQASELIGVAAALNEGEAGRSSFIRGGEASYFPAGFFERTFRSFPCVIRLYLVDPVRPLGSGFFVRASDVVAGENDRPVIVTCHHVIYPDGDDLGLGQINADCEYGGGVLIQRFTSVLKHSGGPMDYCVLDPLLLSGEPSILFADEEVIPDPLGPAEAPFAPRIVQLGHPDGGPLTSSNAANRMIAKNSSALHYGANPMPGMSGGPVCDMNLNVVAVHLGSGAVPDPLSPHTLPYEAGRGTRLSAIKQHPGD